MFHDRTLASDATRTQVLINALTGEVKLYFKCPVIRLIGSLPALLGLIAGDKAIYQPRHLASWLLRGKGITARRFLYAFRIQVNEVATIFLISDEQRIPSELQVANKQPLIVLFTPPEL